MESGIPLKTNLVAAYIFSDEDRPDRRLLLLNRSLDDLLAPDSWQIIYGHVRSGETGWDAINREINEETGLTKFRLFSANDLLSFYNNLDHCLYLVPVFWALAENSERIILNREHTAFKWVKIDEARQLLRWHNQREMLEKLLINFINK